jgi:hypothetical protein
VTAKNIEIDSNVTPLKSLLSIDCSKISFISKRNSPNNINDQSFGSFEEMNSERAGRKSFVFKRYETEFYDFEE